MKAILNYAQFSIQCEQRNFVVSFFPMEDNYYRVRVKEYGEYDPIYHRDSVHNVNANKTTAMQIVLKIVEG